MQVPDPDFSASLQLQKTLTQYRQQNISASMHAMKNRYSMLHVDVLTLLYHFARHSPGPILELGTYVGGATIALAWGVRDAGRPNRIVCVEPGGQHKHPKIPSKDILKDLRRNLKSEKADQNVTIIEGYSWDEKARREVDAHLRPGEVALLIVDSDGCVARDVASYRPLLARDAVVVFDDYREQAGESKHSTAVPEVDALVASGEVVPLGVYGWGTLFGRWRG